MKNKWRCRICYQSFSRWWNLNRHSKNTHGQSLVRQDNQNRHLRSLPNNQSMNNLHHDLDDSNLIDKSINEMQDILKMRTELAKLNNSDSRPDQIFINHNFLKEQIGFYQRQFERLVSENWIISKGEIKAISAYTCNRCRTFSSRLIVDPTYDMTMQVKHRCGDIQVNGNKVIIPFEEGVADIDKWATEILLNQINSCIPSLKYLITQDVSNVFDFFAGLMEKDSIRSLLGIPDRVYLYSLENHDKISWIDRGLTNMGEKIELDHFEIRDFLRRVNSTYAIFEIPTGPKLKRVYMRLTD